MSLSFELDFYTTEILRYLCQVSAPVSSKAISQKIGISERSVVYRINQAKPWLQENGISVVLKQNVGISLNATDDNQQKLLDSFDQHTFYSKEKRKYLIIFSLLTLDAPINLKHFEELLSVSRSTVIKEIRLAKKWLADHSISLLSKPNYGYWVEGAEIDIRESLYNCITRGAKEFNQQDDLMKYCFYGKAKRNQKNSFISKFDQYFKEIQFYYLNNILNTILDIQLTDQSNYSLILRLAILIKRCQGNYRIRNICPGLGDIKQKKEYYWSEFLSKQITKYYAISLGLEEISYLTKYFLNAQTHRPIVNNLTEDEEIEEFDDTLIETIESFLCLISRRLHPSLILDAELKTNLALHLKNFNSRVDYFFPEDNPVIQEIKREYSRVYYIVSNCISESGISYLTDFPDEIGYLTIHIATSLEKLRYQKKSNKTVLLVCNTGAASALLLRTKIKTIFPEITIEDVISYKELILRKNFRDIDFIISTITLNLVNAPPVLVVDVLLKENDIDNLKMAFFTEVVNESHLPNVSIDDGPLLCNLINSDMIALKIKASNWEEATEAAGQILYENEIIENRYINSMKKVIREFGPFMVAWPSVALLHSTYDSGAKKLGMSLVTLEKPVEFGHNKYDPVDIVFALSIPAEHSIPLALDQLNSMLSSEQAMKKIRNTIRNIVVMNQIRLFSRQSTLDIQ